jgi:hypothetical protein
MTEYETRRDILREMSSKGEKTPGEEDGVINRQQANIQFQYVLNVLDKEGCEKLNEIPRQEEAIVQDQNDIRPLEQLEFNEAEVPRWAVNEIIEESRGQLRSGEQLLIHETTYPACIDIMENGFNEGEERGYDKGTPRYKATYFNMFKDQVVGSLTLEDPCLVSAAVNVDDIIIAKSACADPLFEEVVNPVWFNNNCVWDWDQFVRCLEQGYTTWEGLGMDNMLPFRE